MKFPSLLRTRWGAAGSTTFLSASVAALVVAASLSTGAPVSHLQADDASIWLTDNADGAYAHFNDAIGQMQALVSAPAGFAATYHLDVAQSGSDVLAVDRDRGEMWAIDTTADKVAGQGVVLPGGQHGAVATAAGTVAVLDGTTGKVWAHASGSGLDLSGLGLTGHPTATVAGAHALAVSQNGDVVIAAPAAVVRIARTGNSLAKPVTRPLGLPASDSVAVTTVGGQAVVLDTTAGAVTLPDGRRTAVPGAGQKAVLQQPGPTAADVLVATGTALWSVPLTGAAPTKLATSPGGDPAAPVRLDRCSYAAWSGSPGTYAQSCDGAAPGAAGVPLGPTARNPVFRVNHHRVVLNDASDGAAWDLTARPALSVNNGDWRKVLAAQQQNQQQSAATSDNPADAARQDQKPKAVDEEFKARSGRSTVLHILDADSDPNGDVLSISSLSNAAGTGWATTITPDTETAVIRLDSGVTTPVHFGYTIVDAHGRSASATVTVDPVVGETPPHLRPGAATPAYSVISGGTGHYAVLGDWRDDEGDPISLVDASAPSGSVSATSDGVVTFTAPVVTADTVVTITYRVTDGLSAPVAGTLPITVLGRGDTSARPAIAVADVANVVVGAATQVKPLANDVPGADPLHPTAALALAGPVAGLPQVTVATNMTDGTLTVTASAPGVYALTYQAAFGSAPLASGQILVTARPPVTSVSTPVTLPTSVLLHGQLPVTVDVVANDYDPAGGLLTVTGASAPAGISATVVGGRSLRLAATAASLSGQQVVTYSVTNGVTAPVTGQVIVTWVPAPQPGAPITHTVVAVVRAGNVVDVPVLAAASDPAGEPLTLLPTGTALSPVGVGTVGVDGSLLRYAAPATVTTATDVTATYVVQDTSGYRTSGQLVVTVTPPPGPQHPDQPPTPDALEARVVAGGTITIPVPTSGVDPDGDPVAVTGVVDAPQLGRVLSVQPASITYQAYPLSGGTDTFTYEVEDPYGKTGQASVRVAVSPPEGTPAPVAVSDAVTAAPGAHVSVNVLANDIIAPGDAVTILPLARTNTTVPAGATVDGTSIDVVAPTGTEPLVFTYGITDGRGAPSLAQVVVTAGPPGYDIPPVAVDDYATAPPAGQNEVSVKVLANDYDPDGTPGDLTLVAVFSPNAHIDGDQVVVVVGPAPQTIGYEIKDPGGATAIGVVHVPAVDVGPHLKAGAPTIQVPATGSVTVSLADYITDTRGSVRLTSADGISTSPSSGLAWHAVDYTSLSLSAIGGYGGPGSLTVQVTDGTSPNQPGAYTTYVTLPVQVGAPTPVLRCPSTPISVAEGGTAASVDLTTFCQVWTPDPAQAASLSFTATWAQQPNDVSTGWADAQHTILTVTAGSAANPNQTGTLKVDIAGTSVSTEFPVVVTSVPPATATPVDVPGAQTGKAVTVDMRQYVTSPLPSPSVTVLGVTPQQGGVTATTNGSTITFTPQTGTHGTVSFTVQVTDVAGRPERAITDTVTLEVLDVPSAPGAIAGVPGNQQVALSWGAAQPNGSPIQKYVVSMGGSQQSVTGTSYTWTGLTNGTSYTFTVVAVNGVGPGAPVTSTGFSPQSIPGSPGAVQAVPKNQEVDLTWGAAPDNGVAIDHYLLSVNPAPPGGASQQTVGGSATSFAWTGLSNDVGPYTFTVVPHNSLGAGPSVSSSPVYTFGTPATPPAPTATGSVSLDQTTTTVTVSFPAISPCNDAQACAAYTVTEYKSGAKQSSTTAVSTCGGGMCATFGPLTNDGADYTYTVTAANREGLTSPESAQSAPPVKADGVPGPITDLAASAGNQQLTATFTVPAAHGASIAKVDYQAVSAGLAGSWTSVPAQGSQASFTLSGLVNGQSYPLQARACNDNSECGAWSSISTAATAVPYGPPNPPQATATMGNSGSITFGWSGGGGNGRPVDHYVVCIDKSCSNYPASSTSTTQTYACSQSHSVAVSVVDTVGQQSGQASATGSTATCKPPNPPQVSASNGNTGSITYSWSGGGGQGLPLDHYVVCIDGSCSNYPTSTTSTTQAYACGQTHTLGVTAVDSAGQSSTQATATGSTAACPPPTTSPPPSTYSETESPNHGVNTFQDYHNASGPGPAIAAGQTVQVSCKVYDPTIASSNPDGYWYRIASSPWNNGYYATANTFLNGGGTTTNVVNTDMSVPNC